MAKRFIIKIKTGDKFVYLAQHSQNVTQMTMAIDAARLYKGEGLANETLRFKKKDIIKEASEFFDLNPWETDRLIIQIIPVRVEVYAESI